MADDSNERGAARLTINLRLPEPKLAQTLAKAGHPRLAFVLDMTWLLAGTVPIAAAAWAAHTFF